MSNAPPAGAKVYLIGGGPGDPGLISVRGAACLGRADLVLYDALIHQDLLRHCRADAVREFVGKRAGRAQARQQDINQRMVEAAQAGRTVARLKGGDPYLFGRGSEEAEALAQAGIAFEVVPGVPSPLAATAYAGISLSHRHLASSVAYLTATESPDKDRSTHNWAKLATATQTLVIFMGMRRLDSLMALLIRHGRSPQCPAAVIHSASLPSQRTVVGTVADIAARAKEAGLGMPALTVVGEVVQLRQQLRWYDLQPLFGKRVLVTRPLDQAEPLCVALREAGAEPRVHPAIRIVAPSDPARLPQAIRELESYRWLVLTSANGVEAFFTALQDAGGDARRLGRTQVAAIGPATAEALRAHGVRADVVPTEYRGEEVARGIIAAAGGSLEGQRVLLPRAQVAREALPQMLREAGAQVDVVPAYRAEPPGPEQAAALRAEIESGEVQVATFTSSSTVHNTVAALGADAVRLLSGLTVASIGPITTQTAEQLGIRVDVSATDYTVPGLLQALCSHARGAS